MLRVNLTLALVRFIRALAEAAAYVESAIYAGFKTSQTAALHAVSAVYDQRHRDAKALQDRAEARVSALLERLDAAEDAATIAAEERALLEGDADNEYDELIERLNRATGL